MLKGQKKDPHYGMKLTSMLNKKIMSEIRNGDYQHPGEEEAIKIVFKELNKNPERLMLDVGCGRGGTVAFLQKNGWGKLLGIDINKEVIQVAKNKYGQPDFPHFIACDVMQLEQKIGEFFGGNDQKIDVIYLFNSFFLFPDHVKALRELRKISHAKTVLIIFDYLDYGDYLEDPYMENGKLFLPHCIKQSELTDVFKLGGWAITKTINMDDDYIRWYKDLLRKIESYREVCSKKYGEEAFSFFQERYQHILDAFEEKHLGAVTIYAELVGK